MTQHIEVVIICKEEDENGQRELDERQTRTHRIIQK